MKVALLNTLVWLSFISATYSQFPEAHVGEKRFGSIVVRSEGGPRCNVFIIDFNDEFAWLGKAVNGDMLVFVYSKAAKHWLQIVGVDTAGAKLGKESYKGASEQWDLSYLGLQKTLVLPLPACAMIHTPDKVLYNKASDGFALYFDSKYRGDLGDLTTMLIIPRKDLVAAMEYFKGVR